MKISILDIDNGRIIAAADKEIKRVIQNIKDPETDQTEKREINIKIVFKAMADCPEIINVRAAVSAKLAQHEPREAKAGLIVNQSGEVYELQDTLRQQIRMDEFGEPAELRLLEN